MGFNWYGGAIENCRRNVAGTNIAVWYQVRTPEKTVKLTFLNWQTTFDQTNALKPPNNCPKK